MRCHDYAQDATRAYNLAEWREDQERKRQRRKAIREALRDLGIGALIAVVGFVLIFGGWVAMVTP